MDTSSDEIISLATHKPTSLDNIRCLYCDTEITLANDTTEHVVAKKFVPKGTLARQWNLFAHACATCNTKKGYLENDISAITMQPSVSGQYAVSNELLSREAARKDSSRSRWTGERVCASYEEMAFEGRIAPGAKCIFHLKGLPVIDPDRAFELARFHLGAFFYFITYNRSARRGFFWPGAFCPLMICPRSDWGNNAKGAFMSAVYSWPLRMHAVVAKGFFKVIMRRHPDAECWSWALEWNKNYRLIGFFGDHEAASKIVRTFPPLQSMPLRTGSAPGVSLRMRREKSLAPGDDLMFEMDRPRDRSQQSEFARSGDDAS